MKAALLAALMLGSMAPDLPGQDPEAPRVREKYFLFLGDEMIGEVRVRAMALPAGPANARGQGHLSLESEPTPAFVTRVLRRAIDTKGAAKFSGRVLYVDTGSRLTRVLTFQNAKVATIRIPPLDKDSSTPIQIRVAFVPESMASAQGSRSRFVEPPESSRSWLVSNFKLLLGNYPPDQVVRTGAIEMRFQNGVSYRPFSIEVPNGEQPPPMPAKPVVSLRLTDSGGAAALTLAIGPARTQSIAASSDARGFLVTPQ